MVTKDVMSKVVKCCREAKRMSDKLLKTRKSDEIEEFCFTTYGELMDCVYYMLGEHTNEITDSITMTVLNSNMSDAECTDVLFAIMQARESMAPPPVFATGNESMHVGYKYQGGVPT